MANFPHSTVRTASTLGGHGLWAPFISRGKSKAEAEFTPNLEDPRTSSHICIHLTPSWIDGNFWKAAAFWFVFLHLEVREILCETFRAIPAKSRWDWTDWYPCWVPIILSKWCQRRAAVNGLSVSRSPVNRRGLSQSTSSCGSPNPGPSMRWNPNLRSMGVFACVPFSKGIPDAPPD